MRGKPCGGCGELPMGCFPAGCGHQPSLPPSPHHTDPCVHLVQGQG